DRERHHPALHRGHDRCRPYPVLAPWVPPPGSGEIEPALADQRPDLGEVEPAREVVAVREQHPAAHVVIGLQLVIGRCELVDHRQVEGIALRGPIEPHQQHMAVALDRDCDLLTLGGTARMAHGRGLLWAGNGRGGKLTELVVFYNWKIVAGLPGRKREDSPMPPTTVLDRFRLDGKVAIV